MNQQDLRIPEVPVVWMSWILSSAKGESFHILRVHWVLQANSGSEEQSACQSVVAILS